VRYRKLPVDVDALRFTGSNGPAVQAWAEGLGSGDVKAGVGGYRGYASEILRIKTLNGIVIAGPGEWVIRGVRGEFYPCADPIFRETYGPAPLPA
jgi:hypothetical protein